MSRVLIAIDRQDIQEQLVQQVEAEGHEVLVAARGDEVLEQVSQTDLVILGTGLTVFDEYETCSMLRADPDVPPNLPIILIIERDVDHRKLERAGFTDSMSSQTGAYELRERLSQWLSA